MQQLFRLLVFLNQPYIFRATNSPILRNIFWLHIKLLVQCTDNAPDRCHYWDWTSVPSQPWHRSAAVSVNCTKSCIYSPKVLLRMGEFVSRNMLGWIKKINKRKSCCILLVVYIVVLIMHGHTNIEFKGKNFFLYVIKTLKFVNWITYMRCVFAKWRIYVKIVIKKSPWKYTQKQGSSNTCNWYW